MSQPFLGCIGDAHSAGEIDDASARLARDAYQAAYEQHADFGPVEADRMGASAALDALQSADLRARQIRSLAIRTRREALQNLAEWKRRRGYSDVNDFGGGSKPPADGWVQGGEPPKKGPYRNGRAAADYLTELVDGQGGLAGAPGVSVRGRYQAIKGRFDAMMASVFEAFETKIGFDTPGRASLSNMVREAFGEDTGDAVSKALAHAWGETAEYARQLFNSVGGGIGKLEGWGMPQSHDALAVRTAGRETWIEATLPRLDAARMVDRGTGQHFTPESLRTALSEIYDTIASEGASSREPGEFLGDGLLANRRQDERFLVFKSAGDWLEYQKQFGRGDPYATMQLHLDRMARDIAQMQVLGPNPTHQFGWLVRFAEREARLEAAAGAPRAVEKAAGSIDQAKRMLGIFTGELAGPYGRENTLAKVAGFARAWLAGAQLGSAVINDVTSNPVFAAQTRVFTGLSKTPDFAAWAGHMLTPEVRKTARRTGFVVEGARAMLANSTQDFLRSQTVGGKILNGANWAARRLPVAIYRLQLLSQNLAASRWAFQHEFMGALHDRRGLTLAAMLASKDAEDRAFGQTLQARGFTGAEWDRMRAIPADSPAAGANFMSPMSLHAAGEGELGLRLSEMIERQTRLAVPEPSLWAQAWMLGDSRPGTWRGEFLRSLAAYRSFTVTQTYLYGRELMARGMKANPAMFASLAAGHAAALIIPLTLGGALALQMKEIAKGNDPRAMNTAEFWGAAILQGGGLGIAGDFLFAAQARNGKTSALTAMGAPAGAFSDLWSATVGNAVEVPQRMHQRHETLGEAVEGAHVGRDFTDLARYYAPFSSLWWARAVWNRSVVDQLQKMVDPDADEAFRRKAHQLESDFGQSQWWPTGNMLPERGPDTGQLLTDPHATR